MMCGRLIILRTTTSGIVVLGAAGLRAWHPAARMASLCPEIITRKLYSFKHCLAH